jgi:hypothetical protein
LVVKLIVELSKKDHQRVVDAFCTAYGWQAEVPDPADLSRTIRNPLGREDFALGCLREYVGQVVAAAGMASEEAALETARRSVKPLGLTTAIET